MESEQIRQLKYLVDAKQRVIVHKAKIIEQLYDEVKELKESIKWKDQQIADLRRTIKDKDNAPF